MIRPRFFFLLFLVLIVAFLAACATPAAAPASSPAVAPTSPPAIVPAQAPASPTAQASPTVASESQAKVNITDYFPPGAGRELTLESCMGCHSVAPLIIARKTKGEWDSNAVEHRGNVSRLSDAEYKLIYDYLTVNFYPGKPVPKLPPELLRGFTNY